MIIIIFPRGVFNALFIFLITKFSTYFFFIHTATKTAQNDLCCFVCIEMCVHFPISFIFSQMIFQLFYNFNNPFYYFLLYLVNIAKWLSTYLLSIRLYNLPIFLLRHNDTCFVFLFKNQLKKPQIITFIENNLMLNLKTTKNYNIYIY